jgi:hypothetical protein
MGRREPRRPPRDQVGAPASRLKPAILAICAHYSERIQTADARGLTKQPGQIETFDLASTLAPKSKLKKINKTP